MPDYPRIPYGWADFRAIRLEGCLYVDKTRFLRRLEEERYVFLIRPRRFGKSCWVSVLENYYDRNRAGEFEALFGGTDVGRRPTDDRHRYVVLRFDFSVFDDTPETLRERFESYCDTVLYYALERNRDLFPEAVQRRILSPPAIDGKLNQLFAYSGERGIPLYVLIDEYDNFANTILAHDGEASYRAVTQGGGFYRNFFATLKGGAGQGGGLERLFVTGVSPITLDDVTSGFNIARNLSLHPDFNELLGFTEAEVLRLLRMYRGHDVFSQDVDTALAVMRAWYGGYRFAGSAGTDVYNPDMVLYYLNESMPNRSVPDDLIDVNVRIDYGKLRHLLVVGRQLNGNFDLLRQVIGEEGVETPIQTGFPLERLDQPENFLSLLHYFGLLSIRQVVGGVPRLGIPNQTVRRLLYGYLRDAYRDVDVFSVNLFTFDRLLRRMANEGAWEPVVAFLRDAIAAQTGVRDYMAGEKVIQGFLAAYLSVTDHFVFRSEAELGKGHADICLEPLVARYPHLRHGFLIELKYVKRSDQGVETRVAAAVAEAAAQLRRYLADARLAHQYPAVRFIGLAVVFHGWEMVACEPVSG
jgi:hypothetical protein